MADFALLKSLIGPGLKPDDLKNVDCYVHNKLGLFIPSMGLCGYAQQDGHTHPAYMVTILFSKEAYHANFCSEADLEIKPNHYWASILSPEVAHADFVDHFYYCLLFDKDYFESQYRLYEPESDQMPRFEWQQFALCSDILKTLNTFAFECSKSMPNSEVTLDAQTTLITHWIIRSLLGANLDMRSVSANYAVGRVQQYIEAHFADNITVNDLARLVYLSPSTLTRLFKKETGLAPIEYLIETRIEKAKILLRRKQLSITDIAMRCGFGSNPHFTACFKKQTKVSPSEYREAYQE